MESDGQGFAQNGRGEIGQGARFEWKLRGFGTVIQQFEEFQRNERVRILPQRESVAKVGQAKERAPD